MTPVTNLCKQYGETSAVDDLTFDLQPGAVTGFLGPNGAGKTTTLRMVLGLDRPTSGTAFINGQPYAAHSSPMREVGALLDAKALHAGRTARDHLKWLARAGGVSLTRVDEVLDMVELTEAAHRRVGGFSLGMLQRLGLAAALLGDPRTLILDEPSNGLDPAGIRWMRRLLKELAGQGRTVFVSSHLMSEMQQTADRVIVINRGRLVADVEVDQLAERSEQVTVRSPQLNELASSLTTHGANTRQPSKEDNGTGVLTVFGISAARVGELAAAHGLVLHELAPEQTSLETAFLNLTRQESTDEPQEQI